MKTIDMKWFQNSLLIMKTFNLIWNSATIIIIIMICKWWLIMRILFTGNTIHRHTSDKMKASKGINLIHVLMHPSFYFSSSIEKIASQTINRIITHRISNIKSLQWSIYNKQTLMDYPIIQLQYLWIFHYLWVIQCFILIFTILETHFQASKQQRRQSKFNAKIYDKISNKYLNYLLFSTLLLVIA